MLCVHGTPGEATNWTDLLEEPPPGVEVVALDRPGFGASEPFGAVACLACQAEALAPALRIDDGAGTILVGHSMGGPIVLRAACDQPDLVGGVFVIAGNVDPSIERPHWYNYLALGLVAFLPRELRNSNAELMPHRRELEALAPALRDLRVPVAIVHGTDDELVPFSNALHLRDVLPEDVPVRLFSVPGEGHFVIWTRPDVVREALDWLLAGADEPEPQAP